MSYLQKNLFFCMKPMLVSKSEIWWGSSVCVQIVIYKVVWNILTSWFAEMKPAFRLNTFCSAFFLLFS